MEKKDEKTTALKQHRPLKETGDKLEERDPEASADKPCIPADRKKEEPSQQDS